MLPNHKNKTTNNKIIKITSNAFNVFKKYKCCQIIEIHLKNTKVIKSKQIMYSIAKSYKIL